MLKTIQPETKKTPAVKTHYLDAKDLVLGRLSSQVAIYLRGKHKPSFVYNQPCGDKVVIYHARDIRLTGGKLEAKTYYKHTGYLGSLKIRSLKDFMAKKPTWVLKTAISGMMPKNKLHKIWLKNLQIFAGELPAAKNEDKENK